MKFSWSFAKYGPSDATSTCSQHSGYIERLPIHAGQARPTPSACYSVVTFVRRWMLLHQAPTARAQESYAVSLLIIAKPFAKCKMFVTTCNIVMSKDDFAGSTRTPGLDAPPPEPKRNGGTWFQVTHPRCLREADPGSVDRTTVDRYNGDYTRVVLPCHPPEEMGMSMKSSCFSSQAPSHEV